MKKVLIFKMREIAYGSTGVFAEALGKALRSCGASVDFFDIRDRQPEDLERLAKFDYDLWIDFNSCLPSLVTEQDEPFLNQTRARFVNYIVDHPVYHHANLSRPLERSFVLCVDDTHAAYIRQHYPQVRRVDVCPLGAQKAGRTVRFEDRNHRVLFLGTYLDPNAYFQIIKELPPATRMPILRIAEQMKEQPEILFEEAVAAQLQEKASSPGDFAATAQAFFLADLYVRAWYREQILMSVARTGLEMTVCGEKYAESPLAGFSNVRIEEMVGYLESLEKMAETRFVLNIMPWFKSGIHDRVLNAMINGAVSISDSSRRMDRFFTAGKDYIQYSIAQPDRAGEKIVQALPDEAACREMAQRAQHKAAQMTFLSAAKILMEW